MDTIKKNWIGWLITFMIAVLTSIITLAMTNKSQEDYVLKNKVDNLEIRKLDKQEFDNFVEKNRTEIKEILSKQDSRYEEMTKILQLILQQGVQNSTDITWIKREIDKTRKKDLSWQTSQSTSR